MQKLGFHYFPDTEHYRQQDLQIWLPRLQKMGASWLTLLPPATHVIPEAFLSELLKSNIEPLIHFAFPLDRLPNQEDIRLFFKTYARRGVKHILLFNKPNLRSQWGKISWAKTNLVERFLDIYLPLAEDALEAGLKPVFPPLAQGGDYWDTTFLRAALEGIQRRGTPRLVDNLTLSGDADPNGHPLGWGGGGPDHWPEARPYFTPPNSEDHRGFRIIDWYIPIAEAVLGKSPALFMLNLPSGADSTRDILHLVANKPLPNIKPLPPQVQAGMFSLPTAEKDSEFLSRAWYQPKGKLQPIADNIPQEKTIAKKIDKAQNRLEHYLLLPTYQGTVTDWHLEVIRGFVKNHTPTVGFSIAEAAHAKRVTVIGGESGIPEEELNELRAQGCIVRRVTGSGTEIASKLSVMSDSCCVLRNE